MACKTRQEYVDALAKKFIEELKTTNKELGGPAIKAEAYRVAEEVVTKSEALAKGDTTPESSASIRANATPAPKPKDSDMSIVPIPSDIAIRHEEYKANPSNKTMQAIIDMETAYGYRNAEGELLVKFKRPKSLGSKEISVGTPITNDQFEEFYIDTDGSMSKSANINKAFKELDKKNHGENFNEAHSNYLTNTLKSIESMVNSINDTDVKIKQSVLKRGIEAEGLFYQEGDIIEITVDANGPGAEFRTKFSMGNQEVYVHELVHSIMDFIFDPKNKDVVANPDIVAMVTNLKQLYTKALNNSDYKTLLPGYVDGKTGVQYTEYEIQQAKDKWNYIFANKDQQGLHEFMASILTNAMFREGMETLGALDTNKIKKEDSIPVMIEKFFTNLMEKLLGLVTKKSDNSITKEGTSLLFNIMKANYRATDRVAGKQAIKSIENLYEKTTDKLDEVNSSLAKIVSPFVSIFDSLEEIVQDNKKTKILDDSGIEEFVKLQKKLSKVLDSKNVRVELPKNSTKRAVVIVYDLILDIARFIRVLPTIYKMRKMTYGNKRSRDMSNHFAKALNRILNSVGLIEDGFVRGFIRDFIDRPGIYNYLADSILKLTQSVDQVRQGTFEQVGAELINPFGEVKINNDVLNLRNNEALTDVVLRPDIQVLGLDAKGLVELLRNPETVPKKVKEFSRGFSKEQLEDAQSMAEAMITGLGIPPNALNLVTEYGSLQMDKVERDLKEEQAEKLITYLALELVPKESKDTLIRFMDGEGYEEYSSTLWRRAKKISGFTGNALSKEDYKKNIENGVNMFIDRSIGLANASKEEMSKNPHKRIKGYIKETYNADTELEFHPISDRAQLEKDGYIFIKSVAKYPGQMQEYGMFSTNEPSIKRANGALGLQDKKGRGLTLSEIVQREANNPNNLWDANRKSIEFRKVLKGMVEEYEKDKRSTTMVPIYNEFGTIIDFRATMSIADKKKYLGLENRGTQTLARTYATMGTADATARHNRSVIDLIAEDYEENYSKDPSRYVEISPQELGADAYGLPGTKTNREMNKYEKFWARLPRDAKGYAKERFGSNKIIIRKELLTIAFGEDNFSIAEASLLKNLSPSSKKRIRRIESIWQETMQIAKGNIVIKTPEVLIGNVFSNLKILAYVGVHPVLGVKLMLQGARDLKRYEQNNKELNTLRRDVQSGKEVNTARIAELEREIAENSVAPLISAGLYQSIVEDVSTSSELNRVGKFFDSKVDKYITNETANTAVQYLFLTQKTKPYQQLLKATQVSDFYFRYAQYYNELTVEKAKIEGTPTSREIKKIEEKAMRNAIDNYINYEVPLEKHVRYMDSIGSWFFVKYFVKIQRVIKKFAKQHPLKMAVDLASQQFITGDTDGIENSWIFSEGFRRANPFRQLDALGEVISPPGLEILR